MARKPRRESLSDDGVVALRRKANRYSKADPEMSGHYVRVSSTGSKSYAAVARDSHGKQVWATLGTTTDLTIAEARALALQMIAKIKAGKHAPTRPQKPTAVRANSFREIADDWLSLHVIPRGVRTEPEIRRCLAKYIPADWQDRPFADIKRSDLSVLLDHIQKAHGARQADVVLGIIRGVANFYTTRSDTFVSPVVRGMKRSVAPPRDRILNDVEIRAVWQHAPGTFGSICKLALLTGQRRAKLVGLKWTDLVTATDGGTEWRIPRAPREKGSGEVLVLPQLALDVIATLPRIVGNPHVFASRGNGPFNSFSQAVRELGAKVGSVTWTLHDLRRTARSLMSRAGVQADVAERVLGHATPGVAGIYDRHRYIVEKAEALVLLAGLIETILDPPTSTNIVPLPVREVAQ
jgi:integrase